MKNQFKALLMCLLLVISTSCGKDGGKWNNKLDGVNGPHVNLDGSTGVVRVTVVFEKIDIEAGFTIGVPEFPNSFVQLGPDLQSGGTLLSFDLSIEDLTDDRVKFLDPKFLPDGRPLPSVREGKLPATAFTIEELGNSTVYVGKKVFGVFIPVDIGLEELTGTFKYYINEKYAGTVSVIGENGDGEGSGLLLLLNFNEATRQKIARRLARINR